MSERDPEATALLDAADAVLEALRRSLMRSERLLKRASHGPLLTPEEERDVRLEIDATREAVAQLDAMLTLRRQHLRPF
jgi:hypothetical protein